MSNYPDRRVHRDSYNQGDTLKVIDLGMVKVTVESTGATQGIELVSKHLSNDSVPMQKIADRMVTMVRENILTGTFTPIKQETIERRKYPFLPARGIGARMAVGGSQPLVAGRSLLDRIEARSKATGGYAAAQRGKDEWYGFLHNGGVGRVDRREFMSLSGAQADELATVYEDWLMERMDG